MGLKTDLIDAKKEGLRQSGANEEAIQQAEQALDIQCQLEEDAIVNFLTQCKFRVTNLAANVVLEDFQIPEQQGDIQPQVTSTDIPFPGGVGGAPIQTPLNGGRNGVLTKPINVSKAGGGTGLLQSTGYVYIGEDPDSQQDFNVSNKDGQIQHTSVELFREDIEDLLG